MHKTVLLLLVAAFLAGCAGDEPEAAAPSDPQAPAPTLDDVQAALDAGAGSANLQLLGNIPMGGEEADAWEDYVFVDQGNTIHIIRMDLDANGNATFTSVSSIAATGPKDVKVSDDGDWLFLGNDEQASGGPLGQVRAGGFYVYDVSDKQNPVFKSKLAVGQIRGPHMVFYHQQADGTELVLGAAGQVTINRFDRATGTLTELSRYAPDPVTDVNRDPMVIDPYYQLYTHDMFAMEDGGKTLMYTASWDAGLRIVDITDPTSPVELGAWNDYPGGHTGNLHTVATEWIGDRRITVGAVEVGFQVVGGVPYYTDSEASVVYVWDTTDPASIRLLGTWTNPWGYTPGATTGAAYSTHNLQLEHGRVYLAHYGLGAWVLDVSTPEKQATPEVAAFDLGAGNLWDVIVHRGVVLTSGSNGLTGYHFPLDTLGPTGIHSRA